MKIFLLPALLLSLTAFAQNPNETPNTLTVHLRDGQSVQYPLADIQRLTFDSEGGIVTPPEISDYSIAVPTSFASGYVQKVTYNGKQIAEIDREYIKSINKQVDVIYPCGEDGKADLTKGMTTTGASVVWDLDKNTATVGDEGDAIATFYYVGGQLLTAYDGETVPATVEADIIVDKRASETNTYTIVKIGTQYWMAENLRATYFADGTPIAKIAETETDAWKANTTGAYLADGDADWVKIAGYLYSGYCVTSDKGIAPEGWEVPTQAQLTKLRTAGNLLGVNFKDSRDMTWSDGMTGNNITGFTAVATGYYSTATNLTSTLTETYFWSTTKYYDALAKGDVLDYLRVTGGGKNIVVSNTTSGGHSLPFGHAIRCIRK